MHRGRCGDGFINHAAQEECDPGDAGETITCTSGCKNSLCRDGHINPKALITHKVPLDDIADAYHIFSAKLDNCIKPVLVPSTH